MKVGLFLLSRLYALVVFSWSSLYKFNFLHRHIFKTPILSIGNIAVGGTGKTPMTVFVSKLMTKQNLSHVIISRGYKKQNKGTIAVNRGVLSGTLGPDECGDEPYMMVEKLPKTPIIVSENKIEAIKFAINKYSPQVILMDDGFQSHNINKNLEIVLINSICKSEDLCLLPLGSLREPIKNIKRANLIVFTKTNIAQNMGQQFQIKKHVLDILKNKPIPFCATGLQTVLLKYNLKDRGLHPHALPKGKNLSILSVSAIGDPDSFNFVVGEMFNVSKHLVLSDHYDYKKNTDSFLGLLEQAIENNLHGIIVTYKDFVKIKYLKRSFHQWLIDFDLAFYVMDIEVELIDQKNNLKGLLNKLVA